MNGPAPRGAPAAVRTYAMVERSRHLDFDIRDQSGRAPLTQPHKHEYFQIQANLAGATQHHVGGTVRPFTPGTLSFVLPHRMHLVPHPPGTRWLVVNFSQRFLWPDLHVDPLDLEDVPLALAPELAAGSSQVMTTTSRSVPRGTSRSHEPQRLLVIPSHQAQCVIHPFGLLRAQCA